MMPQRTAGGATREALRPLSAHEIESRIADALEALSRAARSGDGRIPGLLAPADVVRCLAPLAGRN